MIARGTKLQSALHVIIDSVCPVFLYSMLFLFPPGNVGSKHSTFKMEWFESHHGGLSK